MHGPLVGAVHDAELGVPPRALWSVEQVVEAADRLARADAPTVARCPPPRNRRPSVCCLMPVWISPGIVIVATASSS